ncbi:hypothetical protein [Klenkia taihuensis]|uniref:Uncharacterized protein n=1 Tax=Klenkia taihuensis TaxID=1225127 RepID=A0A1I1H441_9ACTN|nr:hypothetical protein [Klenkia taihuensis]GHE09424.1 hypothetical protein GCM10011381_14150 [Klenkia taihuensis]SFC18312.1 hypothetical protein SAMN05661030_0320 [Klenkia taihuensis]
MTEPASVVVARQLAVEALYRLVPPGRRTRARQVRAVLLAAGVLGTAGCGAGDTVCPAIGYGSVLVVELSRDWPAGSGRSVELDCDPACPLPVVLLDQPTPIPVPGMPGTPAAPTSSTPAPAPDDPVLELDDDGTARLALYVERPGEVTARVRQNGAVVAEVTVRPEFVRVDGTAECGGNAEARIVVPAP